MNDIFDYISRRRAMLEEQQYYTIIDAASILQVTYYGFYKLRLQYSIMPSNSGRLYYFSRKDIVFLLKKLFTPFVHSKLHEWRCETAGIDDQIDMLKELQVYYAIKYPYIIKESLYDMLLSITRDYLKSCKSGRS
jgi:hypothetical protein